MTTPRKILRSRGLRPRKKLGQCFLQDRNILEKIAAMTDIGQEGTAVEIGAGTGALTELLAGAAGRVLAIEVDPRMTDILRERFREQDNIEILQRDVLSVDFSLLADEAGMEKITVVGNIPYSLSTPILFHLLAHRRRIRTAVLMFQKELAARLAASPGTKEYGIPSVLVAAFARVTQRLDVPATCFYPVPRVHSRVLRFDFLEESPFPLGEEGCFTAVVRASFASRRKTIFNNLKGVSLGLPEGSDLGDLLLAAGIDPGRRGETLSPAEFGRLSIVLLDALRKGLDNTIPV
ncbi:MAG: ribosomal RNA small subunit methyltransferase A [Deltaproteobacteria bacterium HGW-Deltaproteobacteria-19]|jgi:16S rRNA (adenine1518-N6/adenine1519-N6)-dimethyltransferase|nr:MAG: ribosomal RNA small subunit methyltransferase A [Deltaproteobacteria bacterium HGW-Deltaproteobacteria-19]